MSTSAEAKARWLFAAVLLVIAAGAAGWAALYAGRYATYEIQSRDPVSGLLPGAPVEFHGVEVGRVHSVQLLQPGWWACCWKCAVTSPSHPPPSPPSWGGGWPPALHGLCVREPRGHGQAGAGTAPLPGRPYPLLASAPAQIVSLDTAINQMNQTVQAVGGLLQATLDPATVAALKQSLASVEQVAQTLSANNRKLEAIIANAERASLQVQPLLQSSSEAVKTLQNDLPPQTRQTLLRLDGLSSTMNERMGVILQNTEQASLRFEPLLQSSSDAMLSLQTQILPEAQRTITRLDQLSASLGETSSRIRRNPSLLLRGGPRHRPGRVRCNDPPDATALGNPGAGQRPRRVLGGAARGSSAHLRPDRPGAHAAAAAREGSRHAPGVCAAGPARHRHAADGVQPARAPPCVFRAEPMGGDAAADAAAAAGSHAGRHRRLRRGRTPPYPGTAALALRTEILELVQDFGQDPPVLRLSLRVRLSDDRANRVLATREIALQQAMQQKGPRGGVAAANEAVARALRELAALVLENAP